MTKICACLMIAALLFCCLFAACTPKNDVNEALKDTLKIEILKIGKADCSIITDGKTSIVVDCGEEDDGAEISAAMDALGISSIDYLIITHYDKDHIGGAPTLLKKYKVSKLLEPDYTPVDTTAYAYMSYRNALAEAEANGKCGSAEAVSDSVDLTVSDIKLNIVGTFGKDYAKNQDNNDSLVVSLEHLGNSFLFAGDIEKQRIADMLSQGRVQSCDFLKVPHHGVYNSKLEDYFSKVNMKYAVITCSDKNPAEQKTLDLLTAKGCRTFLTSNGTVHIRSTKSGIDITQ